MAFIAPAIPYIAAAVGTASAAVGVDAALRKRPEAAKPPLPATQDTAANAANQQALLMRQRRGVLANIYGGGQGSTPATATSTALGN